MLSSEALFPELLELLAQSFRVGKLPKRQYHLAQYSPQRQTFQQR